MPGLYLHIPFCKQACTYCDFHFSTSDKYRDDMVAALFAEMDLRQQELPPAPLQTLYFGGGTPSVFSDAQLIQIMEHARAVFGLESDAEITLEANPDDLSEARFKTLKAAGINRLSVGIQTFDEATLRLLNRAHSATQAHHCLHTIGQYFNNYSIDLMYGLPHLSMADWAKHIQQLIDAKTPHISCYALTVESKTVLHHQVVQEQVLLPSDEVTQQQFLYLSDTLRNAGYEHYEVSNFALPGKFSKHNTAYWQSKPYLGIGPSAHSFDGQIRSWNVSNNAKYMNAIQQKQLPIERETLSLNDRYNEYIMTGLRTQWGVQFHHIQQQFGNELATYFEKAAYKKQALGHLEHHGDQWRIPHQARFLSDGIAADLFQVND
ncbi:MAG: coproporphyrinogen III oxidase [Flavobacterium sp. BFFFF2]|nr:MAG: coproporphyrinogen III oxidase [Flavobacterium sp. BFFFF2]